MSAPGRSTEKRSPLATLTPIVAAVVTAAALVVIVSLLTACSASVASPATVVEGELHIIYALNASVGATAPVSVIWTDPRDHKTHTDTPVTFPWVKTIDVSDPDTAFVRVVVDNRHNTTPVTGSITTNDTLAVLRSVGAGASATLTALPG